jgi:hypothetical protein
MLPDWKMVSACYHFRLDALHTRLEERRLAQARRRGAQGAHMAVPQSEVAFERASISPLV